MYGPNVIASNLAWAWKSSHVPRAKKISAQSIPRNSATFGIHKMYECIWISELYPNSDVRPALTRRSSWNENKLHDFPNEQVLCTCARSHDGRDRWGARVLVLHDRNHLRNFLSCFDCSAKWGIRGQIGIEMVERASVAHLPPSVLGWCKIFRTTYTDFHVENLGSLFLGDQHLPLNFDIVLLKLHQSVIIKIKIQFLFIKAWELVTLVEFI